MALITTPQVNSVFSTGNSKLSGPVTVTGGTNCSITASGQTFTVAYTGGVGSQLRSFCNKATISSTSSSNWTNLFTVPLTSGKTYGFKGFLSVSSTSGTPGFKMAMTGGTGASFSQTRTYYSWSGNTSSMQFQTTSISSGTRETSFTLSMGASVRYFVLFHGAFELVTSTGDMILDFAQNTTNATATIVDRYSWMQVWEL